MQSALSSLEIRGAMFLHQVANSRIVSFFVSAAVEGATNFWSDVSGKIMASASLLTWIVAALKSHRSCSK